MRSTQRLAGGGILLFLLAASLSLLVHEASSQGRAPRTVDYQLLTNPSLETYDPPYAQFEGIDCQVATGWERFWYDGPAPYWMDSRVFASSHLGTGHVEVIHGDTSQLIIATEPYSAGIRQQVSGLTPGQGYGFHAAMLTIYQTSYPPAVHGTMIKQVGVDPTGGTDPTAPSVVWSEPDDHDEGPWDVTRITAAWAEAPTMTAFIRVLSPLPSGGLPHLNYSIFDSTILARTPSVTAVSPEISEDTSFVVWWDNAVPSCTHPNPDLCKVKWYDVEWLDEEEGVWHTWITFSEQTQALFSGDRGHRYRFRARAWQSYPNGAHLFGPYRPDGDSATYVKTPELVGRVLGHDGDPVTGATVAISGSVYATSSGPQGRFEMKLPPLPEPQAITVSHPMRLAPAPVYGVLFGLTETVALTWTLRPIDDAITNGGFEAGMDGWTPLEDQGIAPRLVDEPVHTGHHALALGGSASAVSTVGVSQTVTLSDAWEPGLSFWYHPTTIDPEDRFNVLLTVVTSPAGLARRVTSSHIFTPALDTTGWQHLFYSAGPPDARLTGTLTVRFQVWSDGQGAVTTISLDEVSLGSTPGGPHKVYLPLILHPE